MILLYIHYGSIRNSSMANIKLSENVSASEQNFTIFLKVSRQILLSICPSTREAAQRKERSSAKQNIKLQDFTEDTS